MDRLAAALEDRAQDTARLVTAEMGMPISASRLHNAEVPVTILRYYAALARALQPEEIRAAVNFRGHTIVRREPVGVSAVIAPWNYPLALAFSQLAPALAAGCTVVLKPAAQTSLSAYILAEAFEAADFPPGVFNLVTGAHEVAELLARHPGVDKVSFAGPLSVGRRIAVACGETFKSVSLETGGKAAAIVLEDADLAAASVALGRLAFANCGQTCFAASRVLAPRSRYDDAVAGLTEQAAAVAVGDPMAAETSMGPLVSPRRRAGVESYVAASAAEGARVVVGGRRPAAPVRGYYYEPTLLGRGRGGRGERGVRPGRHGHPVRRTSQRRWRSPTRPAPGSRARCGPRTPIMGWTSRGASTSGRSASTCTCRISARRGAARPAARAAPTAPNASAPTCGPSRCSCPSRRRPDACVARRLTPAWPGVRRRCGAASGGGAARPGGYADPAWRRRVSALSVRSQVNSGSSRPKCP